MAGTYIDNLTYFLYKYLICIESNRLFVKGPNSSGGTLKNMLLVLMKLKLKYDRCRPFVCSNIYTQ